MLSAGFGSQWRDPVLLYRQVGYAVKMVEVRLFYLRSAGADRGSAQKTDTIELK
jgi:hypothetical protein